MSTALIQLIVQSAVGKAAEAFDIQPGAGTKGQTLRLKVQEGFKYQLKDLGMPGQKAPEVVKLKRVGKDLLLAFDEVLQAPDVVLENYYDDAFNLPSNLVGEGQTGRLYSYALEASQPQTAIKALTEGQGALNAYLTGAEMVVGSAGAVGLAALNLPVVGAGTLGAVALGNNLVEANTAPADPQAEATEPEPQPAPELGDTAQARELEDLMQAAQLALDAMAPSLTALQEALNAHQTNVGKLGTPATPAQLKAVEDSQATVDAAAAAVTNAANEVQAALDAVAQAAQDAGVEKPDGYAAIAQAVDTAQALVVQAQGAVQASEATTDAAVQKLTDAATAAGAALALSQEAYDAAAQDLTDALADLTEPATPAQLAAIEAAQEALTDAATDLQAAVDAAQIAMDLALAAAEAANETAPDFASLNNAIATATADVSATPGITTASEATTDAAVKALTDAATAAGAALALTQEAYDAAEQELTDALAELTEPATPAQLAAIEAAQEALTSAATDLQAAVEAAQSAMDLALAAAEAANETAPDFASLNNAIATATADVSATPGITTASEATTDAAVKALTDAATAAGAALALTQEAYDAAEQELTDALAELTEPATPAQLAAIEAAQEALTDAATDLQAAVEAAQSAMDLALAAAEAANETAPDFASLNNAIATATADVSATPGITATSEATTDAVVKALTDAATAAGAALALTQEAYDAAEQELADALADLTEPATPAQLAAIEAAQEALTDAATDLQAAVDAAQSAMDLALAAAEAANETAPDFASLNSAIATATADVSATPGITTASEATTDAAVKALTDAATAAGAALALTQEAYDAAEQELTDALAELTEPATPTQLAAIEAAQEALTSAATDLQAAVEAAQSAMDLALAAAEAANETAPDFASLNNAIATATADVSATPGITATSEATTDAAVQELTDTATAAGAALALTQEAYDAAEQELTDALAELTEPATPAQLAAIEAAQEALMSAATDLQAAVDTAQSAMDLALAAAESAKETAPDFASLNNAIATATADVSATPGITTASEATTDAAVKALTDTATAAGAALALTQEAYDAAEQDLADALAALDANATPEQLAAVAQARQVLTLAAADLDLAATAAEQAMNAALAAADAANEMAPNFAALVSAIDTAQADVQLTPLTLASARIEAYAQSNGASDAPELSDYTTLGVMGIGGSNEPTVAMINSALADSDITGALADSRSDVQTIVNGYAAMLAPVHDAGGIQASAAQYQAIGVATVDTPSEASLLGDLIDQKTTADVDNTSKVQALADVVQAIMDVAALDDSLSLQAALAQDPEVLNDLASQLSALGLNGVTEDNLGAVWSALRDSANDGSAAATLAQLQAMIDAANDRPVAADPVAVSTSEDNTFTVQVGQLLGSAHVQDADADAAIHGVAISWNRATATQGVWQWRADGQSTWADLPANTNGNAAVVDGAIYLNASDALRFVPANNYHGPVPELHLHVADNTHPATASGTALNLADFNLSGQSMTVDAVVVNLSVSSVNDAPTLDATSVLALNNTVQDAPAPSTPAEGTAVADVLAAISDIDPGDDLGLAITSVNPNGTLFFSTDGGQTWQTSGVLSDDNALHLDANSRVYFQPQAGWSGSLSDALGYRAWDQTNGVLAEALAAVGAFGGTSAYSAEAAVLGITVDQPDTTAPVFSSGAAVSVPEDTSGTVYDAQATDAGGAADVGITYSLSGTDAARFSIDPGTGAVRFVSSPDFEAPADEGGNNVYDITVTATDVSDNAASQDVAITVTDGVDIGQATISLGAGYGTLTAPVQIDGRTYYYWNTGKASGWDVTYDNFAEGIFKYDINGNVNPNPTSGPDNTYRFATLNGVKVAMPTAGVMTDAQGFVELGAKLSWGTSVSSGAEHNNTYNDLLAVWDAYNGTGTGQTQSAMSWFPTADFRATRFWSATPTLENGVDVGKYALVNIQTGAVTSHAANGIFNVMVEVLSSQAGTSVIDLGASKGKLINPVEVEGKWFYAWDRNGSGTLTANNYDTDFSSPDTLSLTFNKDIFGNTNPQSGMDEVYRFATLKDASNADVKLAIPTYGGMVEANGHAWFNTHADVNLRTPGSDTAVNAYGTINTVYDDFAAIRDAGGIPGSWINTYYKTASRYTSGGVEISGRHLIYLNGMMQGSLDWGANGVYALEVVKPNLAPTLADTSLSFGTASSASLPVGAVGLLVSQLTAGVTDGDSADPKGVAIVGIQPGGTLWYSLNGGANWLASKDVSASQALLLGADADNRVFFQPGKTMSGTVSEAITFRAWDRSRGEEGQHLGNDTRVNGGAAPFSAQTETVSISVGISPIVLDINSDGQLSYSQAAMDVNGDGRLDQTAWAGAQDGVLVWDKHGDGQVTDSSQYAFTQYGGKTDLEGLAAGFDSNADGVFDAADEKFAEFAVWQDANGNGVSDAGEVRSLSDVGIASIDLTSDGEQRNPAQGVSEAGRSTAQLADGTQMLVADAAFAYNELAYRINPEGELSLLGEQMDLHLSSFVNTHGAIHSVDLSGTGANRLSISLADVLGTESTLRVLGDADDSVVLDAAQWTAAGTAQSEGHSYAVYAAVGGQQLWLEQHIVMA